MGSSVRRQEGRALADSNHLRLIEQGARAVDSWRKARPGVPLDLSGATLAGARLQGMDLGGCNLSDADLSEADLSGANLFGANLVRARLAHANLAGVLLRKADLRKADLSDANLAGAELEGADLTEAVLAKANLSAANLKQASLAGARLDGADLGAARLRGADLRRASLKNAVLSGADLQGANLVQASFPGADLVGADLQKAIFREGTPGVIQPRKKDEPPEPRADLRDAHLQKVDLRGADLTGMDLAGVDLRDAKLSGACLVGSVLSNADLGGTDLQEADISGCDFVGVRFDATTLLRRARVKGARVDRHTLESLKDYGGLTPGDRMQMTILDGVSLLRSHYSGFWQYIHLFALFLFAYPYAYFVFFQYAAAESGVREWGEEARVSFGTSMEKAEAFVKSNPMLGGGFAGGGGEAPKDAPKVAPRSRVEIPLWRAIARFIWNGGKDWEKGYFLDPMSFGLFVFSFCYNLTRFVMVFKTAELQLHQEATGLPVPVSALGFWGKMVFAMEIGFCINVVVVLVHSFHFLQHPIVLYVPGGG